MMPSTLNRPYQITIKNNPSSIKEPSKFFAAPVPEASPVMRFAPFPAHTDGLGAKEGDMAREKTSRQDDATGSDIGRLRARFAGAIKAVGRVADIRDLDSALQEAADGARTLTDARYGAVRFFDGSRQIGRFFASAPTSEERVLFGGLPEKIDLPGCRDEIHETVRFSDLGQHRRSVSLLENHPAIKSLLAVPVRHLDKSVGTIYVAEKEGGPEFTDEDEEILAMFASQAAIAILNALRHEEDEQAKDQVETEKRRLAALVGSSPVGVLVVDAETRTFASVNQEAERILGMSPEPGTTLVRYHEAAIYRRTDGTKY